MGAEKRGEDIAGGIQAARQLRRQEIDGFALHLETQLRLDIEHRGGTGAEGSVIQIDDGGVQGPVGGKIQLRSPRLSACVPQSTASPRGWCVCSLPASCENGT